jgi:leukotriene-A4 hydrolase
MRSILLAKRPLFTSLAQGSLNKGKTNPWLRFLHHVTMPSRDPNTLSNYDAWVTKHTKAIFTIDFEAEKLKGSVSLNLESQTDKGSKEVVLDASFLDVTAVRVNSKEAEWKLQSRKDPFGSPLEVKVPEGAGKGEMLTVDIDVTTTDKCTALQWLTPEQTSNNKAPFMFSQCQAIHARSLFPCQDTPAVKSTFDFEITSPHVVLASGLEVKSVDAANGSKTYYFEQKVPIPSYLFALASGDIVTADIGPRSKVATGPNEIDMCQWEFKKDMEKFMEVAEKLVFPYKWGEYNVLILPPSFPYGGKIMLTGRFV